MQEITSLLMFEGKAEEAMNFYLSLFKQSSIIDITYYEDGPIKGKVKLARFALNGREFMCIDSSVQHGFTFTPSISLVVNCETEEETDALYKLLSAGATILMPLSAYPFSKKFCWLTDRFGVSWQLKHN